LQNILLTEAFGCERCQRIFALDDSGRSIEELSAAYPYRCPYYWNGKRWRGATQRQKYDILWTIWGIIPIVILTIFFPPRLYHAIGSGLYFIVLAVLLLVAIISLSLLLMGRD
jgi:hypothetical protein